jgi:hypothetical protein
MPRQSSASLEITLRPAVHANQRLDAPKHLSEAERGVWIELVNDQPADAFTVTHIPALEAYCRHVVFGRVIADELAQFDRAWLADADGLKRYDTLLKSHERETRAASSQATRLRITRQSLDHGVVARKVVNMPRVAKPWEIASK